MGVLLAILLVYAVMAVQWVVLGGLLASTLVTLIVVPCLYYLVERRRAARVAAAEMPEGDRA